MVKPKVQASSSRAGDGAAFTFGSFSFGGGFVTASSPFSYLAESPDVTRLSDPQLVVIFKNLVKKDATTKARALEEFQAHLNTVKAHQSTVEDAVLDVWVALYPRTSIDTTRRVRLLAQNVQSLLALLVGKSLAKHLPKVAGPWLLGSHDTDQGVTTATQEALTSVFAGDRLHLFRKAYQSQILQTCVDLIETESFKSLSDERIVSHDEAVAKYDRVVSAAIGLLISLLSELAVEDRSKLQNQYVSLLSSDKLWQCTASADASVRRSINLLLRTILKTHDVWPIVEGTAISSTFIEKSLKTDQSGTAADLIATLADLTSEDPDIWSAKWKGKKFAYTLLRRFVQGGSYGGPKSYWQNLAALLHRIPKAAFPSSVEDAQQLIEAYQQGISARSEPKSNQINAHLGYIQALEPIIANIHDQNEYTSLLKLAVGPMMEALIFTQSDQKWTMPLDAVPALTHAVMTVRDLPSLLCQEWPRLTAQVIEMLKKSLPESSKDYTSSQDAVKETGLRWTLATKELRQAVGTELNDQLTIKALLWEATTVCSHRGGKPYAAAVIVQVMVKHLNQFVWQESNKSEILDQLIQKSLPRVIMSPSSVPLCAVLQSACDRPYFKDIWRLCIDNVAKSDLRQATAIKALAELLKVAKNTDKALLEDASISALSQRLLDETINGQMEWQSLAIVIKNLGYIGTTSLLTQIATNLCDGTKQTQRTIQGLRMVAKESPSAMEKFTSTEEGHLMLRQLLLLAEQDDGAVDPDMDELRQLISSLTLHQATTNGGSVGTNPMVAAILNSLETTGKDTVSIDALVSQAMSVIQSQDKISIPDLLPDLAAWRVELDPFLSIAPSIPVDILDSVTGTVFVVDRRDAVDNSVSRPSYDRDGMSIPLRKAIYTVRLMNRVEYAGEQQIKDEVLTLVILIMILVNENLSFKGSNSIFDSHMSHFDGDFTTYLSDSHKLLSHWIKDATTRWDSEGSGADAVNSIFQTSNATSSHAYYASRAYELVFSQLTAEMGLPQSRMSALPNTIMKLRRSENLLETAAFMSSHRDFLSNVPACKSWYNTLVAEATGLNFASGRENAMRRLYMLNVFLATADGSFVASAAQQRLVFLFRDLVHGLESTMNDAILQTLMLSILVRLCQPLQSIYGDYWETMLDYIKQLWQECSTLSKYSADDASLNRIFESQRLYRALIRLSRSEDCNEDLTEALAASSTDHGQGLLHLLALDYDSDDGFNQPLRMIRNFTATELQRSYTDLAIEPDLLYPILTALNHETQACAFTILHNDIPKQQAQISLDVAIDQTPATISDALLSLTLDAPDKIDLRDLDDSKTQSIAKRYFYSWMLVFDHFDNASHQLQVMYLESIKSSADLGALLDIIHDVLRQTRVLSAKSLSFDVASFETDPGNTPQQEVTRLACHMYYLSLVHTSSIAKTWWLNAHRTVSANMATLTENHITPLVILRAFSELEEWTRDQNANASSEDKPLTIKANRNSREVIASLVIGGEDDERSVSICVSLPSTFPLNAATVLSRSTTSTFEARKWQSWLMIAQGAITFNNNSIADGLMAWRRNVTGALQGKSECTICYSLVSEDGKLPNKECKTCKHAFHMICLNKWFASSGDRKCPLCRSDFVGLGRGERGGRRSIREE